ncbi:Outer membrane protein V [Cronobacter muytjensii 530]
MQARHGAFFFDTEKGLGYDLQSDSGVYVEQSLGVSPGRADKDSDWRDGADSLKGMGSIKTALNTGLALGWAVTPWLVAEGKATLPLTDSQGVQYQTSLTLLPFQDAADTVAFQTAVLFGDSRYMNTFYGVSNSLIWSHQFGEHWGTTLSAGYTWLGDNAADSPIVRQRNQTSAAVAVTYTF